jgi:hypothetical protein
VSIQPHFRLTREARAESTRGRTTHLVPVVLTSSAQAGRAVGRPRDDLATPSSQSSRPYKGRDRTGSPAL